MNMHNVFNEVNVLHELQHYLPSQAPLKDFIHHNTLHAFQSLSFHKALHTASDLFGYKTYLSLKEYRELFGAGKIDNSILENIISSRKDDKRLWKEKLLFQHYEENHNQRIGKIRSLWKEQYSLNMEKEVHPLLFRIICSYLDQGISQWQFPHYKGGLLNSIRHMENNSFFHLFKSNRVKNLLHKTHLSIKELLSILIADEQYYKYYLFDQQFLHPGWSGMVSFIELNPSALLDKRTVSLRDFIILELLLEIDFLDTKHRSKWQPLTVRQEILPLFSDIEYNELFDIYSMWQEAFEWTYYDQVLKGLQYIPEKQELKREKVFQALCCIDDRECSFRRYLEQYEPDCETFGTAGFFNMEMYFQPEHGKFHTKVCPAPLQPEILIREKESRKRYKSDIGLNRHSHGIIGGWFISQTVGFWSALQLVKNIFLPSESSAMVSSFSHMDKSGKLLIEREIGEQKNKNLFHGFTVHEMATRIESLLKSIGLTDTFAPLVYIIGHGASSVNNTHYAGYDCGACSGRPGSVNARIAAMIANRNDVRELLKEKGISIPPQTQFVGALHDTTRDEIEFYDTDILNVQNKQGHSNNIQTFNRALDSNAKERSRRFIFTDTFAHEKSVHETVKRRAVSLFEPRPEWNHATNALCIVGRRETNKHLFLDRRSFLNSYDYSIDPNGEYLLQILRAVAPVCGGINLEYYFSKVDNSRLGAGTKLPHNVMGLIGVANGMDGDLRTGLPKQMINIHDPIRLMVIVEHFPDIVLQTIREHPPTYEWFNNNWVHLTSVNPETKELSVFREGVFIPYTPLHTGISKKNKTDDMIRTIESTFENLPVHIID